MNNKFTHFFYCPWTGLGLYGGFRGNRWLRNRIQIFKQFVIPSLQAQTSKDFILWCSWRPEEKNNKYVKEFMKYLEQVEEFKSVHTFHGILFWDDKYPDVIARDRLLTSIHDTMGELTEVIGDVDYVYMTIQPSDDLYNHNVAKGIQAIFDEVPDLQAFGFDRGYICSYRTKEIAEYNPKTNPPFFTIKFPRDIFIDPLKHANYISIKKDVGKYLKGTPYPSHEYIGDALRYATIKERGFCVGTHGENISTHFNHPYKGQIFEGVEREKILKDFGIDSVDTLKINFSWRKKILSFLPYRVQRKLRYIFGELIYQRFYEFLRS